MTQPRPVAPAPRRPPRDPRTVTAKLKAERIQVQIQQLPGWHLARNSTAIARVFTVPNLRAATIFTAFVAEVAGGGDQDLEITVRGTAVTVTLTTPRVGGLTQRDLDVASRLEFPA